MIERATRRILVILVVVSCAPAALALVPGRDLTLYSHDLWQRDLPQNTVQSIVQTRDGYLWLATHEGIVRFNGVEFEVFD